MATLCRLLATQQHSTMCSLCAACEDGKIVFCTHAVVHASVVPMDQGATTAYRQDYDMPIGKNTAIWLYIGVMQAASFACTCAAVIPDVPRCQPC